MDFAFTTSVKVRSQKTSKDKHIKDPFFTKNLALDRHDCLIKLSSENPSGKSMSYEFCDTIILKILLCMKYIIMYSVVRSMVGSLSNLVKQHLNSEVTSRNFMNFCFFFCVWFFYVCVLIMRPLRLGKLDWSLNLFLCWCSVLIIS